MKTVNKIQDDITYYSLNLPWKLQFVNGNKSEYSYDASEVKRRAKYSYSVAGIQMPIDNNYAENSSISSTTVTDYCGNYIYKNNSLKRILPPEGYIAADNRYNYFLKDHLGSTRVNISVPVGSTSYTTEVKEHSKYLIYWLCGTRYGNLLQMSMFLK